MPPIMMDGNTRHGAMVIHPRTNPWANERNHTVVCYSEIGRLALASF